ncbi:hypothetical protein AB3S75_042302 [Citrus x aurantiifolia]
MRVCSLEESRQFAVILKLMSMVNGQWLRGFQWSRDFHGDEPNEEETVHAQPKTKQRKKLFGFVNKQAFATIRSSGASDHRRHGLDIHATPSILANPRTTTPGKVNYVLGGVARNVAECMSKLGAKPNMISALALDMAGIYCWSTVNLLAYL